MGCCGDCCSRHTLIVSLVFIFTLSTIGLLTASLVSIEWFTSSDTSVQEIRTGLWRVCTKTILNENEVCVIRPEVLEFSDSNDADSALLINILALFLSLLSVISALIYICYLKPPKWSLVLLIFLHVLAAFLSIILIAFVEVELYDSMDNFDRGWGFFIAYAALGTAVLAAFFACCLPCAKSAYFKYRTEKRITQEGNESYHDFQDDDSYDYPKRKSTKKKNNYEEPVEKLDDVRLHRIDEPRMSIYDQNGHRVGDSQYRGYKSDVYYAGNDVSYNYDNRRTRASYKRVHEPQPQEVYYPTENIDGVASKQLSTYHSPPTPSDDIMLVETNPQRDMLVFGQPRYHSNQNALFKYESRASQHEDRRRYQQQLEAEEEERRRNEEEERRRNEEEERRRKITHVVETPITKPYVIEERSSSTFPEDQQPQRKKSKVIKKVVTTTTSNEPRDQHRSHKKKSNKKQQQQQQKQQDHKGYGITLETSHKEAQRNQVQVYDHSGKLVDKVAVVNTKGAHTNQAYSR